MDPLYNICDIPTLANLLLANKAINSELQTHMDHRVKQETKHVFVRGIKLLLENETPTWQSCCSFYRRLQSPASCCDMRLLKQLYRHQHIEFIQKYFFMFPDINTMTMATTKERAAIYKNIEDCMQYMYTQGDVAGFDRRSFCAFVDIVESWARWVKAHNVQRTVKCSTVAEYRSLIHMYYHIYGTSTAYVVLDIL